MFQTLSTLLHLILQGAQEHTFCEDDIVVHTIKQNFLESGAVIAHFDFNIALSY